ncbi:MAG: NrfD/PsrC family molybdoenzyme membrane anchor subunit [Saprospiraceae bacterium]|nr:NrfD/PsrC family molybdoenzyme membrane anchor subunit [Saprospiraceae bacterium]
MNQIENKQIQEELMPRKFGQAGKLWTILLVIVILLGGYFYVQQIQNGLSVTGLGDYNTWGIYISNFVFFVAISLVGSLISAILKLSNVKWQVPLTRISEMIAVAAIAFAAIVIIIDMGRPDRFMNVILKARIQSPITWDVIVITTYFFISIILLYLPLIPDLALMRDQDKGEKPWLKKLYRILALNWRGTELQGRILKKSVRILSVLIIPVAFGIHTVTSWLFATTFRPGWDSTNFGPYFVSGAFMVGAGAVICAMYVFRRQYGYEKYLTDDIFNKMGKLLVLLSLVYLYFNVNEYLAPAFKMKAHEVGHLNALFTGEFAPMFWSVQVLGMMVPIIVLLFPQGRKPLPMFIISILVILGAWFKRFLIVVPTLSHPLIPTEKLPQSALHYMPTFAELSITAATLAGALLIITVLARIFPVIPVMETIEENYE